MLVEVVNGIDDKKDHNFLETFPVVHPLLGVGGLIGGAYLSSQQLTMTRVSRESNQSVWAGRGPRVKVNLLIFKDEKT